MNEKVKELLDAIIISDGLDRIMNEVLKIDIDEAFKNEIPLGMLMTVIYKCAEEITTKHTQLKSVIEGFVMSVTVALMILTNKNKESDKDLN